jgi:hypothetical protein
LTTQQYKTWDTTGGLGESSGDPPYRQEKNTGQGGTEPRDSDNSSDDDSDVGHHSPTPMSEAEDMSELNVGDEIISYRPGPGVEATHENQITRKIVAIDPESEYPLILDSSEDFLPIKLSRHHDVLKKDGELRYSRRIEDFELVKQGNPDTARAQTAANTQEAGAVLRSTQNNVVTTGNNLFRQYTPKKKSN